jgi:HSP20 family molecular chaperone IbpA
MQNRDRSDWMWGDALDMLARAERLHSQLFQPTGRQTRRASWEPPVDVLETPGAVLIIAALPGVREEAVELAIDGACLVIAGERVLPDELRTATIHRLELPQGRFERRVALPPGRYDQIHRRTVNGCLVVSLRKIV